MRLISGEFFKVFICRIAICECGFFWAVKAAKIFGFFVYSNAGHPFSSGPYKGNPFIARFVGDRFCRIHSILRRSRYSEIFPSIIRWVSINMINMTTFRRPCSCLDSPDYNMGSYCHSHKSESNPTLFSWVFGGASNDRPGRPFSIFYPEAQYPCLRIISELARGFRRVYISNFHMVTLGLISDLVNCGNIRGIR